MDKCPVKKERTDESMASENITLYIKGDRNVDDRTGCVSEGYCQHGMFDKVPKLQTVKILKLHGNREQRYVINLYWKSLPVSMLRTLK